MTSSSSLYGTVTTQNVSSTNSTSLYGEAGTPIPDSSGNLIVRGDLLVLSGNILTTATTGNIFPANATTINLGLAATAVNIGAATGSTTINNTLFAPGADFGNITVGITTDNTINTTSGNLILDAATNTVQVSANLSVDGTTINLAQNTDILYSENNNRLNRPNIQSTTGNTSGLRIVAPNATASAISSLTTISTDDSNNTTFISLQARGSANPLRLQTGQFIGGVQSASNESVTFADFSNIYATVNPAGPTIGTDLTTKTYVDAQVAGGVTSITGTANQVIASSSTGAVTLSLPQSIATTSNVTFADVIVGDDLTVQGNNVNLAQATTIGYDESGNRANRPQVQSTTGNNSGFRVLAPNATTSANSNLTAFATNDINNGEFISLRASGSTSDPFNFRTGKYTTGVLGASGKSISFVDNVTAYATINPAGPTVGTDLTTKTYVDGLAPGGVTSVTGGTHITASPTTGAVVVSTDATNANTASTIVARDASGNFSAGTVTANLTGNASGTAANITATSNSTLITLSALSLPGSQVSGNISGNAANVTGTVATANGGTGQITYTDGQLLIGNSTGNTLTKSTLTAGTGISITNGSGAITIAATGVTGVSSVTGSGFITASPTTGAVTIGSNATDANTASTIVARDASGNFSAGTITAALSGNATTATTAAQVANSLTAGTHLSGGPFNGSAAVTLSTDATNANTASTIVARDASGDFSAGTITAALSGNATTATTAGKVANALTAGTYLSGGPFDGSAAVTLSTNATSANTASTLVARDASGNFSAGTITANFTNGSRVLGAFTATPSTTYTFSPPVLTSITDNNGVDAASSYDTNNGNGNGAQQQFTHYFADTFAALNTTGALAFRTANGNSETTGTVPFTGIAPVVPSATLSTNTFGTINYAGYATTGFASTIASASQGGGRNVNQNLQIQAIASENLADGTLTISGATITAVTRSSTALASVSVTGTKGQISFTATTPALGNAIVVTGTNSGTATGISAGTYYITLTGSTSTAQLSLTPNGSPITTTAGTTTGLTFTRQFITVTYSAQSYIPFGLNALVTISGFTNVTAGTYAVQGTSTTTSVIIGAVSTGVPALSGSQSISCPTVTNGGGTLRVRAMPLAKPMNSGNRVELILHSAESATYRADAWTFTTGAYGATGTTMLTMNNTAVVASVPIQFPVYTAAGKPASGVVGQQISISNSPTVGGRMAFWDTTNTRWSYVSDNSAV